NSVRGQGNLALNLFAQQSQLTDFSFVASEAGRRPVANRVQPGKRPRSSMSPTLVFERGEGALRLATGSPGGPHIIHYTAKALLGTLAWGLTPQAAIDLPNFGSIGGPTILEQGRFTAATVEALRSRGHVVEPAPLPSGVQLLERRGGQLLGGSDPRREGAVRGE
ncbi:gamma-glutamyltransferase, partial [Caldimonas tepidiphila]|uniref:gamma-glutamyltransferase n=1 Tax=Caldimonas tepidiphila TaxID=2315841 RepID=UPI00196AA2AD